MKFNEVHIYIFLLKQFSKSSIIHCIKSNNSPHSGKSLFYNGTVKMTKHSIFWSYTSEGLLNSFAYLNLYVRKGFYLLLTIVVHCINTRGHIKFSTLNTYQDIDQQKCKFLRLSSSWRSVDYYFQCNIYL